MARIRSVHPGLWTDEAFVSVSPLARLLFIGIWNECDDKGAFEWKPIQLKMRLLPVDNVEVWELLSELEGAGLIQSYIVEPNKYGAVRNFGNWQRPKKPNSVHPMPHDLRTYAGPKVSSSPPRVSDDDSSSEPDTDELAGGSPPPPPQRCPVPPKSEIAPQMEEGGGRGEKEEKSTSLRSVTAKAVPPDRGSRLPEAWAPGEEGAVYARQLGLDPSHVFEKFRGYWLSKPGKEARKTNWAMTWKTWCRNEAERGTGRLPLTRPESTMTGTF